MKYFNFVCAWIYDVEKYFVHLDTLLPYKKRPESTGMVARNLVAGALGIRSSVSREKRQKEKEMLKEARGNCYLGANYPFSITQLV